MDHIACPAKENVEFLPTSVLPMTVLWLTSRHNQAYEVMGFFFQAQVA